MQALGLDCWPCLPPVAARGPLSQRKIILPRPSWPLCYYNVAGIGPCSLLAKPCRHWAWIAGLACRPSRPVCPTRRAIAACHGRAGPSAFTAGLLVLLARCWGVYTRFGLGFAGLACARRGAWATVAPPLQPAVSPTAPSAVAVWLPGSNARCSGALAGCGSRLLALPAARRGACATVTAQNHLAKAELAPVLLQRSWYRSLLAAGQALQALGLDCWPCLPPVAARVPHAARHCCLPWPSWPLCLYSRAASAPSSLLWSYYRLWFSVAGLACARRGARATDAAVSHPAMAEHRLQCDHCSLLLHYGSRATAVQRCRRFCHSPRGLRSAKTIGPILRCTASVKQVRQE